MPQQPSLEVPDDAEHPARHPKAPGVGERTPPHTPQCLGCADLPHGLRMESWVAGDDGGDQVVAVLSRFEVRADHQGGPGLLHGGLLATAFDDALGCVPTLVSRACVTARLEVDFRRPVPVGTVLWLHSRLDGQVGRKLYVSGTAHLDAPDGPLAGTARALFVKVGGEHFLRHSRPEELEALGVPAEQIQAARA